jgi:hypothetical protein
MNGKGGKNLSPGFSRFLCSAQRISLVEQKQMRRGQMYMVIICKYKRNKLGFE